MVDLGNPNIVLVDLFVSEAELATQSESPAVETAVLRLHHRVLLPGCNADHVDLASFLVRLAQTEPNGHRFG